MKTVLAIYNFSSWLFRCQIFTSWDSTILARVFLILRAVSLEAGLWAQHSDMSFRTARRHWKRRECSEHIKIFDNTYQSLPQGMELHLLHHCSTDWTQLAANVWHTQPHAYLRMMDHWAPYCNMATGTLLLSLQGESTVGTKMAGQNVSTYSAPLTELWELKWIPK